MESDEKQWMSQTRDLLMCSDRNLEASRCVGYWTIDLSRRVGCSVSKVLKPQCLKYDTDMHRIDWEPWERKKRTQQNLLSFYNYIRCPRISAPPRISRVTSRFYSWQCHSLRWTRSVMLSWQHARPCNSFAISTASNATSLFALLIKLCALS